MPPSGVVLNYIHGGHGQMHCVIRYAHNQSSTYLLTYLPTYLYVVTDLNQWSTILDKLVVLVVTQPVKKFLHFTDPEDSRSCSQHPDTNP